MGITRIDCHLFRGAGVGAQQSSYVAINPHCSPGSMVMAGASAVRDSLGSQVAAKLALQHFVDAALACFDSACSDSARFERAASDKDSRVLPVTAEVTQNPLAQVLIERAFKAANDSVYQFAHKLAAGGRLAASLIGLVIEDGVIAAGRVGSGNAYLCRDLEVFPFFEASSLHDSRDPSGDDSDRGSKLSDGFVGTQSLVSVELASVELRPYDVVFLTGQALDSLGERELYGLAEDLGFIASENLPVRAPSIFACDQLVRSLYPEPQDVPFAMVAVVGPQTVLLRERGIIAEEDARASRLKDQVQKSHSAAGRSDREPQLRGDIVGSMSGSRPESRKWALR